MSSIQRVLIVGGGAREHALCKAIAQSKQVQLSCVMKNNNPGINRLCADVLLEEETDCPAIVDYAVKQGIDMVCIGPEAPLQAGLTNALIKKNISVCAPSKQAARIETDKEWMRNLLQKYNIPGQLQFQSFTLVKQAQSYIELLQGNVALKPIGLTGGKGVWVHGDHFTTVDEAMVYVKKVISEGIGGSSKILVEEKAIGEEFTIQGFTDGAHLVTLPAVQDHKRLLPGDKGVNTGGMGSYSCSNGLLPFLTQQEYDQAVSILQQIIDALSHEQCPYVGPIYGQFMVCATGVKVIEINARFGDPEVMNVLPLLKNQYVEVCQSMVQGNIHQTYLDMEKKATVCKYVVPEGYGHKSLENTPVHINEKAIEEIGALLFYASVNQKNKIVYTTTSRALAVVGIADSLEQAEKVCKNALEHVQGDHIFIRHDIGTAGLLQKRIDHIKKIREDL